MEQDSNRVKTDYYDRLWKNHPEPGIGTVGWGSESSQKERFVILEDIGRITDCSVLDVGCGLGDLCEHLSLRNKRPSTYLGIDMMDKSIEEAQKRYGQEEGVTFVCDDFMTHDFGDDKFDYVLASGMFGIETEDWWEFMSEAIQKMFALCNIGIGMNFQSDVHKKKVAGSMYVSMSEVAYEISNILVPWIIVRHEYRSNDFTVFVYKTRTFGETS